MMLWFVWLQGNVMSSGDVWDRLSAFGLAPWDNLSLTVPEDMLLS